MAGDQPASIRGSGEDERLLIEAAQRDPRRFAELYELYFDRIYAYAVSRVRERSIAQDVTSEVFHHALRNLPGFEWRGVPFVAWLYRIAANAISDLAHRAAREQHIDPPESSVEPDFEHVDRSAEVFRLVRELPADQLKVIEMRFVDELSIREIAREIGRSEGAVKQLQFRALQNLRDRLREPRLGEKHG